MRITTTSNDTSGKTTAITIEVTSEKEDLKVFEGMLSSHKWIRMNEYDELESAPAHRDPPLLYDKKIDPIWDGKPATPRILREAEKKNIDVYNHRSFYVQHITGNYNKKAQKLIINGFVPLRSKKSNRDGKCWEIWYLPGAWAAEGELRGKEEKKIFEWLFHEIKPGNVEFSGESWGLCVE